MADFDVQTLRATAFALVGAFALAAGALVSEPGTEELGGVEVVLEVADDVGGADALGLVDGWIDHSLALLFPDGIGIGEGQ